MKSPNERDLLLGATLKNDHGIAGTAHDLVYGQRAKDYGHPRIDFDIIANVWTGLLKDKLKDGARLDPYRVAVMMTGLKLARLVQSPEHKDSRIDTIGYMLTMERLDEVEEPEPEPLPLPLYTYVQDKITQEDAERQIDKLLGRETAEHSAELDAQIDTSVDGPVTSPHHPVNIVLRGFLPVEEISWENGVNATTLDGTSTWMFSGYDDMWYWDMPFDPADHRDFKYSPPLSFRNLRSAYAPLVVTSGVYKGLLILKEGVGYVAER